MATSPPTWPGPVVLLHRVTEGARAGLRSLSGLVAAAEHGRALAAGPKAGSHLGAVVALAVRQPAVTAADVATRLAITPQAALRLLARLVADGLLHEVTGRRRFQGLALKG